MEKREPEKKQLRADSGLRQSEGKWIPLPQVPQFSREKVVKLLKASVLNGANGILPVKGYTAFWRFVSGNLGLQSEDMRAFVDDCREYLKLERGVMTPATLASARLEGILIGILISLYALDVQVKH